MTTMTTATTTSSTKTCQRLTILLDSMAFESILLLLDLGAGIEVLDSHSAFDGAKDVTLAVWEAF